MDRPYETLDEAKVLFELGYTNTYINRLYYACFYSVSALLILMGFSSSKHSGVRALFHKEIIKTEIMDHTKGKLFDRLFDTRQKADYADMVYFEIEEVQPWIEEVKLFINSINNKINKIEKS